jgi:hypothetical protein
MSDTASNNPMILRPNEIEPIDRGTGVKTIPLVGKWNAAGGKVTTGITVFEPGTAIPLHTHNVEETVTLGARRSDRDPGFSPVTRTACP